MAPAAVDRDLLPQGAQQQTRRTLLLLSIDGTDKRTDRRTLDRSVAPAPRTIQQPVRQNVSRLNASMRS